MKKIVVVAAAFVVVLSAGSVNAFTHEKLQKQLKDAAKQLEQQMKEGQKQPKKQSQQQPEQKTTSKKSKESFALPECPGSYDRNTWTDCFGSTILPEGTTLVNTGDHYQGEWKNGKPDGKGTLTRKKNGEFIYVGEFKNGGAHGQGTFTIAAGGKYVGEWKDDKMHGQGTFTFADGRVMEGIWENNKFKYAKKTPPTVTVKKSPTPTMHDKLKKQMKEGQKQPKKQSQQQQKSSPAQTSTQTGSVLSRCDAPYEPMGPKFFGNFYGGDNLRDVQCKLLAMKSEDPSLKINANQWGQQAGPSQFCNRRENHCIVKIGKLGDFGEKLNNQYINLMDTPWKVSANYFVINNVKFGVEFGFTNGGVNKYLYGYPIYRLEHGKRSMFAGAKDRRSPGNAKNLTNAASTEILYEMLFKSMDAENVVQHNAKSIFAKFDNAFKDYKKTGHGDEFEYSKGSKLVRLRISRSGGNIEITYQFDISQNDENALKMMKFFNAGEQKLLNKNKKKDSGKL